MEEIDNAFDEKNSECSCCASSVCFSSGWLQQRHGELCSRFCKFCRRKHCFFRRRDRLFCCGENAAAAVQLLNDLTGSYQELWPVILADEYQQTWLDDCTALVGEENAEAAFEKLSSMVTGDVYGEDAVEAYANGGGAYFCGFTNDLATLTFDGETSTISGTDKDGNVLFSHTYHYIGMEPVHGLYEFESDDADSGEFTYFFLAPDTSAETYHIEFRYGSDAEALSQYDAGEYAYWVASGISTDCDQTMIDNCIELFCTENLAG